MMRLLELLGTVLVLSACSGPAKVEAPQAGPYELVYSTLLDGESGATWEHVRDIVLDDQGFAYVVGGAASADFPVTSPAFSRFHTGGDQLGSQGASDAFVMKLSPRGEIVWSTLLGGPNYDRAYAVEVDAAGEVYVAGRAGAGFPTTPGVIQRDFAGDAFRNPPYGPQDGFVAKLSADGGRLIWSTYVGDAGRAFIRDMDIDAKGRVYLALGNVNADMPRFITPNAWQRARLDGNEGAYIRLSADATRSEYGTYFGGAGSSPVESTGTPSLRVGKDGSVVLVAQEASPSVAVTRGAVQTRNAGGEDILVLKFAADDHLVFATYLGGSEDEILDTHHLALDDAGRIYLTAGTRSADFPVTPGARQKTRAGPTDAIVSVLSPDGRSLVASTYLGGTGDETVEGVAVAPVDGRAGSVVISGRSSSPSFPGTVTAVQAHGAGGLDGFVAILPPDLATVRYATLLGGKRDDWSSAVGVSPSGTWIAFGGQVESHDFPTTDGAFGRELKGVFGGWVALLKPRLARADPAPDQAAKSSR